MTRISMYAAYIHAAECELLSFLITFWYYNGDFSMLTVYRQQRRIYGRQICCHSMRIMKTPAKHVLGALRQVFQGPLKLRQCPRYCGDFGYPNRLNIKL